MHPTPTLRPSAKDVSSLSQSFMSNMTVTSDCHSSSSASSAQQYDKALSPSKSSFLSQHSKGSRGQVQDRPFAHIFPSATATATATATFSPGLASSSRRNHFKKTDSHMDDSQNDMSMSSKTISEMEGEILRLRCEIERLRSL